MKSTGNLFDYIAWRGDIPFTVAGFNDVDNLVFSLVSYAYLDGLVTNQENTDGITMKEYYDRLVKNGGYPKELDILITEEEFRTIAESTRFGSVLIRNYVDIIDQLKSIQFCAMDFCFGNHEHYIAFRGTDDSIAGWKEDLLLTCKKVPAQDLSSEYLNEHILPGETYYIGGHSKGGNLAIYGAAHLGEEKLSSVKQIYSNDAPGLVKEVMDASIVSRINQKTTKIVPEYSVIGMFFPNDFPNTIIVDSYEKGLLQHNIKSWYVHKEDLETVDHLDPEAVRINEALTIYISQTEMDKREKIINELFDAIDDKGKMKTLSSVRNGGIRSLQRVMLQMAEKSSDSTKAFQRLPFTVIFGRFLVRIKNKKWVDLFLKNKEMPSGLMLVGLGILFILIPFRFFPYVIASSFLVSALAEIILLFYNLYMTHWNVRANLSRIYICTILGALSISFFISSDALAGFACIILGIGLLIWSFHILGRIIDLYYKDAWINLVIAVVEVLFLFSAGLFFIISDNYSIEWISSVIGWPCIVFGIVRIVAGFIKIWELRHNKKKNHR